MLSVNPLSFLLKRYEGYKIGKDKRDKNVSHLFFVDHLKLYALSLELMMKILESVTTFSKDVGMNFGESKCAFQIIERRKRKHHGNPLRINGLSIKEVEEGDTYRYLGIGDAIGIADTLNKEKVLKEFKRRTEKIWTSELNAKNKITAHNTFAVSMVTPTIGILNWTKDDIKSMDIMTRKQITTTGGFHHASDIVRSYPKQSDGGRGLNPIQYGLFLKHYGIGGGHYGPPL